ncbi:MAG TPA: aminotransferase class I and II, partial [Blastocatellia bacterium]|nr:aminotransferase class I and II [Blastocatellia bacterium]
PEIQDLIRASGGLNLGIDYLPGAVTFDPLAEKPDAALASSIVWFDGFVTNVDRTPRNVNLLIWHRRLYLIDHGATLYFHHSWNSFVERSRDPFQRIRDHVLLPFAGTLGQADSQMTGRITPEVIDRVVRLIPESWLVGDSSLSACRQRDAYVEYLVKRLRPPRHFVEEAIRARSSHV